MKSQGYILLVEDDMVDIKAIRRAFKDNKINNPIVICNNGEEALEFLTTKKKNDLPILIFLDLNMPRMNGLEFLKNLKNDDLLKTIPTIILTTSKDINDKKESFKSGVAGYMVKPMNHRDFSELIDTINKYWTTSELP